MVQHSPKASKFAHEAEVNEAGLSAFLLLGYEVRGTHPTLASASSSLQCSIWYGSQFSSKSMPIHAPSAPGIGKWCMLGQNGTHRVLEGLDLQPGQTLRLNLGIFGKRDCTGATLHLAYGLAGGQDHFCTRQLARLFHLTIHAPLLVSSLAALPSAKGLVTTLQSWDLYHDSGDGGRTAAAIHSPPQDMSQKKGEEGDAPAHTSIEDITLVGRAPLLVCCRLTILSSYLTSRMCG
jgi:hypothetical protein